jgi:hypothetical protein
MGPMIIDTFSDMHITDSPTPTVTAEEHTKQAKQAKNKRRNRSKKLQRAQGPRLPNAAHVFTCSLCPGSFNRGGLIDHL